ncbi:hypothetical protein [Corallococcus carmarthensis]|uniref:hypothetical protein n=1 Tax=Corallococcus carmarthensis TaxID=2316728 RepID=UPI0011C34EF2|nr:hypothetical protein [Corallococcus carmarthensis]
MSQEYFKAANALVRIEQSFQGVERRRKEWVDSASEKAWKAVNAVAEDINRWLPDCGGSRFKLKVQHLQTEIDHKGFEVVVSGPGVGFERNNTNRAMDYVSDSPARLKFSQDVRGLVFVRIVDGFLGNSTPVVAWSDYYEPSQLSSNDEMFALLVRLAERAEHEHWTSKKDALPPKP